MSLLQRYTRAHPEVVSDAVRETYEQAKVNSITTLQAAQPMLAASESLLPQPGIRYHTIAGSLPGQVPPGDGIVPVDSARLPGAESTLVVKYGHQLYDSDEVIAEVVRILHADIAEQDKATDPPR
jgi:hypothetical protein